MASERSAFIKAPEVEDVDHSLHKERVDNKSLCDRRDVDHTNTCSNFALSKHHTRTKSMEAGER